MGKAAGLGLGSIVAVVDVVVIAEVNVDGSDG